MPPAARPGPGRSRAAERRRTRAAGRSTRAAGWPVDVGALGRAGGQAPAHPRTGHRRGIGRGSSRDATASGRPSATESSGASAERPTPASTVPAHLHSGRPVAARCPVICHTPGAQWMHEDSPPAHRSPQPPPGRSLRKPGQVAMAVRVRRTRVVVPKWLAGSADGGAGPPKPGTGGVGVRSGGNRGLPDRTSSWVPLLPLAERRSSTTTHPARGRAPAGSDRAPRRAFRPECPSR